MNPLNILIVEDDRVQRAILEKTLRYSRSVNVFLASSVTEAAALLANESIDGAILDLVLQQGSGLEVARLCREKRIPVVFCTASHDNHNLNLMYEYGFVLPKPAPLSAFTWVLEYFDWVNFPKGEPCRQLY